MNIPFTKPFWGKEEEKAVVQSVRNRHASGDGPQSKLLIENLKKLTGAKYVFPVTSCTHGLELAMLALGIGPGDEVILPSFTMTSTANCVVLRGGTPVFADIEDTYFCIDPVDIEKKITKKTRGIIIVHYAGMGCRMEEITKIAKKHKLFVVEDAAHAIGAIYLGKSLGNWGDIGVYSFHGTKNVACGEGGAVLTNNSDLSKKLEIYRANGTNRNAFLRGKVAKYHWLDVGSSYFLSDMLAAVVNAQLAKLPVINRQRTKVASYYTKNLSFRPLSRNPLRNTLIPGQARDDKETRKSLIALPSIPNGSKPNWHIYALRFFSGEHADIFLQQMRAAGVEVSRHYVPLHSAPAGRKFGKKAGKLPVTDQVYETLVRLPIYPGMKKKELSFIVTSAQKILRSFV
jgi:dTDP-4-amino-4,6-dideoxygalactose transaminase